MKQLNAADFKAMVNSGAANLENYQNEINALNVFPVPDGDTGTNMAMTFSNGAKEAANCLSTNVGDIAKALSKGLLMGARGNSGVITSQIFRGFYQSIDKKETIRTEDIASAFENGSKVAYKAIMKPIEGTILTVIRESSAKALEDYRNNKKMPIEEYFTKLVSYMKESVDHTPDLLPVLKDAGVVDSGGMGLYRIAEGFLAYLKGEPVKISEVRIELSGNAQSAFENDEFGYCTEYILRLEPKYQKHFDENILKKKLAEIGESLVLVKDEELIKVHVHTLRPGEVLNLSQRYGEFIKLKIENMQEQHSELIKEEKSSKPKKKLGIIAVASGTGIEKVFLELGVDALISGGQTMNPSTSDFIDKIEELENCEEILIFPNNSNILMSASQAAEIKSDAHVSVVHCTSISACLSALTMYDPSGSAADNLALFEEIASKEREVSLTYAVKDSQIDGVVLEAGDYMAMSRKSILSSGKDLLQVAMRAIDKAVREEDELVTIITGEENDPKIDESIMSYIEENTKAEVQLIKGDIPVYYYLLGIE